MTLSYIYAIASVLVVSLISLIGVFTISIQAEKLKKYLIYLVSFAAGSLFGGAFIHLLPSAVKKTGFSLNISLYVLSGILFMFLVEKVVRWRHCHCAPSKDDEQVHPVAIMNLVGDGVHNFIDGLIIGASYVVSVPVGIAATIAVIVHEIPQEIGDFGVLLHGGYSRFKALLVNFLTAVVAVLGVLTAFLLNEYIAGVNAFLIPFAVGNFVYIAGADLIPELHNGENTKKSVLQFLAFVVGISIMLLVHFGLHNSGVHNHEEEAHVNHQTEVHHSDNIKDDHSSHGHEEEHVEHDHQH